MSSEVVLTVDRHHLLASQIVPGTVVNAGAIADGGVDLSHRAADMRSHAASPPASSPRGRGPDCYPSQLNLVKV